MPNASYPAAAAPTVAEIWNKLIADSFTAASIGQRLKDAVGLDTFVAARITDIANIRTPAQYYDTLISDARAAGSYGQRLKDAVALDTFIAARITDITKISSAAIAVGDTANSIAQKLRGATDNQVFPTAAGMVISSFDNSDFSMTESQTVEIIPATGESDFGMIIQRSGTAADTLLFSADSGVNYIALTATNLGEKWGTFGQAGTGFNILGIGNSTGRYKIVTTATVQTRNFVRIITTFK